MIIDALEFNIPVAWLGHFKLDLTQDVVYKEILATISRLML
jgi:hypothetical protein